MSRAGSFSYRLHSALLSSLQSDSDEEAPPSTMLSGQYRRSEGGGSEHRRSEGSLSAERYTMKEQLENVKSTLNQLVTSGTSTPVLSAPGQPGPSVVPQQSSQTTQAAPLENLMTEIASRLSSIEHLYTDMSGRLARVDNRVVESERTVRELQHISAGAINETARLVDHVARAPSVQGSITGSPLPTSLRPAAYIPAIPRGPRMLDHIPGSQLTATIQQHASQIHKLIAGLDFLEQHIIRQDQVIEGMQKQTNQQVTALLGDTRTPSELALKVHDLNELVNKLRAHLYKVEKKSGSTDAGLAVMNNKVNQLTARVESLETRRPSPSADMASSSVNPLFFADGSPNKDSARPGEPVVKLSQLMDVVSTQNDLRTMVHGLSSELQLLKQQMPASPAPVVPPPGGTVSRAEHEELRAQLAQVLELLGSQQQVTTRSLPQGAGDASVLQPDLEQLQMAISSKADLAEIDGMMSELERTRTATEKIMQEVDEVRARMSVAEAKVANSVTREELAPISTNVHELVVTVQQREANIAEQVQTLLEEAKQAQALAQENVLAVAANMERELAAVKEQLLNTSTEVQQHSVSVGELKADLQERIQLVLARIQERVQEHVEQMSEQLNALQQQMEGAVRVEQLPELLTSYTSSMGLFASIGQHDEAVQAIASEVEQLKQQVEELSSSKSTITELRNEMAELYMQQQGARGALDSLANDIQHLADRLDGDVVRPADLEALKDMVVEAKQLAQQGAEQLALDVRGLHDKVAECAPITQVLQNQAEQEQLKHAVAKLILDISQYQVHLAELGNQMAAATSRLEDTVGHVQFGAVVSTVEEMQQALKELEEGLKKQKASLDSEYISRDKLAGIFAAREDMMHALHKLESVFSSGNLDALSKESLEQVEETLVKAGVSTPRVTAAVEDLQSRMAELQQTVQLLLYRSENSARQDQLASMQQAMVTLEMQVKRVATGSSGEVPMTPSAARGRTSETGLASQRSLPEADVPVPRSADFDQVMSRMEAMQQQVDELRSLAAAASTAAAGEGADMADALARFDEHERQLSELNAAVRDLQLMVVDVKSEMEPGTATCVLPEGGSAVENGVMVLQERLEEIEVTLVSKLMALEAVVRAVSSAPAESSTAAPAPSSDCGPRLQDMASVAAMTQHHQELETLQRALASVHDTMAALRGEVDTIQQVVQAREAAPSADSINEVVMADLLTVKESVALLQSDVAVLAGHMESLPTPAVGATAEELQELSMRVEAVAAEAAAAMSAAAAASGEAAAATSAASAASNEAAAAAAAATAASAEPVDPTAAVRAKLLQEEVEGVKLLLSDLAGRVDDLTTQSLATASALQSQVAEESLQEVEMVKGMLFELTSKVEEMGLKVNSVDVALHEHQAATEAHNHGPPPPIRVSMGAAADEGAEAAASQALAAEKAIAEVHGALDCLSNKVSRLEVQLRDMEGAQETVAAQQAAASPEVADVCDSHARELVAGLTLRVEDLENKTVAAAHFESEASSSTSALAQAVSSLSSDLKALESAVSGQASLVQELGSKYSELQALKEQVESLASSATARTSDPGAASTSVPSASGSTSDTSALETRLDEYKTVLKAMRDRIVAMQGYVDSNQAMVKELHGNHSSVVARLAVLEASHEETSKQLKEQAGAAPAAASQPESVAAVSKEMEETVRHLQADLLSLESKFAMFETNNGELTQVLQDMSKVTAKLGELDAKDNELNGKLAAIGQTMPVLAGQLKALERRLHGKLDMAQQAMEALASQLVEMNKMAVPQSKNPFGGNKEAVQALEIKMEGLRRALFASAAGIVDELRQDKANRTSFSGLQGAGSF